MEHRPAPPVTIEGGPGWQVEGPPSDLLGDEPPRRPLPRPPRGLVLTALGVVLGFLAATLLQDWRTADLRETADGALSLEASGVDDVPYFELADDDQGRLSTVLVVALRNTGSREVELRAVDMPGTGFVADDADGVRVRAGSSVRVVLLRPVDCDARPTGPPGELRVRALTAAGERERRLRVLLGTYELSGQSARVACGQVPAAQALQPYEQELSFDGPSARLELRLRSASDHPVVVQAARTVPGLALVLTGDGAGPLQLPLQIPAGDYSRPRRPLDDVLPERTLTATVTVADCTRLPRLDPPESGALVELDVDDVHGRDGGTVFLGDVFTTLPRLRAQACPDQDRG